VEVFDDVRFSFRGGRDAFTEMIERSRDTQRVQLSNGDDRVVDVLAGNKAFGDLLEAWQPGEEVLQADAGGRDRVAPCGSAYVINLFRALAPAKTPEHKSTRSPNQIDDPCRCTKVQRHPEGV
jgi:hypothetical protein